MPYRSSKKRPGRGQPAPSAAYLKGFEALHKRNPNDSQRGKREQPTPEDLAEVSQTFAAGSEDGPRVTLLKPYWQRHPKLFPRIPGTRVTVALWADGTTAPVPADADKDLLKDLYAAARMVAALGGAL